jgi:GT2 family glycosyltransferase
VIFISGAWEKDGEDSLSILVPYNSSVSIDFARALHTIEKPKKVAISTVKHYGVDMARNELVNIALKLNMKYILFWDTDVIPYDNNAIIDLIYKANKYNLDIVSGNYASKRAIGITDNRYAPSCWIYSDKDNKFLNAINDLNGIKECDTVGLGFCLIKADIFKDLSKPYFKYITKYDNIEVKMGNYTFKNQDFSEDFYFCVNAKNHGYKIYYDFDTKCYHEFNGFINTNGIVVNIVSGDDK